MTGVRFSATCGWEGFCAKQDGGCGKWWPLSNACWSIANTIKRCRACYNASQRTPEERVKHAAYMRRYRAANREVTADYQRRYRRTPNYKTTAAERAARARERRAGVRALLQEGLDVAV